MESQETIYWIKNLDLKDISRDSALGMWFYDMVRKKVTELSLFDISRMLRQGIYLEIAVPLAWEALLENPFCGEMWEGQLLELLLRVVQKYPETRRQEDYARFMEKNESQIYAYEWDMEEDRREYETVLAELRDVFC